MRLADLPDNYPVTVDTETSRLHPDDGGRIAAVSFAFRVPDADGQSQPSQPMIHKAVPFDQGITNLPLGEKVLNERTIKRLSKWPDWALDEDAHNLSPQRFNDMTRELARLNLIWHNAKFDQTMFRTGLRGVESDTGINLENRTIWDTQLAQRVLEPKEPVGLKPTAVRLHLGAGIGVKEGMEDDEAEALKPWLGPKQGKNADPRYDLVPWSIMGPYAGMDAVLTLLLWEHQWDLCYEEYAFVKHHIQREIDLMKVLYRMEGRGVRFDVETGFRMEKLLEVARAKVAAQLPFEPTPNNARKFFFGPTEEGGLGHVPFSDKVTEKRGDPQVDDEVITRLAAEDWDGQEVAKVYQEHEGIKSAMSKWYSAWTRMVGKDGRIRTTFKQANVVSGRLAVERFQAQAIPQPYQMPKVDGLVGVRDLFFEDTPCLCGCGPMELWEFDVSQAEIRIATAAAQCRPMLEGIQAGIDSHTIAALLMFGDRIKEDDFEDRPTEHPQWDVFRQIAKRCNLGILYGAGAKVIREQLLKFANMDVPLRQVSKWIDDWKAAFPEMVERQEKLERMAVRLGYVKLVNGRQRYFSAYEPLHKAFNQEIQGSLAEVMKDFMIEFENRWYGRLLLQTHDSVTARFAKCEIEKGVLDEVSNLLSRTYERAFTFRWKDTGEMVTVPFKSDAKQFGRKAA